MIKFLIVFLMVVGIAVTESTIKPTSGNTTNQTDSSMSTGQAPTMSTGQAPNVTTVGTTSGTGTGGFRLHSFNWLFLPLTITATISYLSC